MSNISIFLSLLLTAAANAKVICAGDCQGTKAVRDPIKQELTTSSVKSKVLASTAVEEELPANQEAPLVGKNHGKKYVTQKYFNDVNNRNIASEEFLPDDTNLPGYFFNLNANEVEDGFAFTPKTEPKQKLSGLTAGSVLKLVIRQDIVASSKVPTPIVGTIVSGLYEGSKVYGEAILDDELKRVLFNFKTITGGSISREYIIKASGLDVLGRVGMQGDYHADDITFGIASFFATATAIAADAQVERSKNAHGDYVENPSAENATKKGVAGALGKVAERLSNRAINAPGRTEIQGPLLLQVILDESPYIKK